jgi:ubiquinone/menaquinone biosynthesis C-methylase UbiE
MTRRPVAVRYQDPDVAEAYDRGRFHSLGGRYKNWRLYRLLNQILKSLPPHSLVLDMPCGTGRIDNWLLKASARVIAADISSEMLVVARQKIRPKSSWLGFLRADASHLPFRSRSVDGVLSIRFLHLLDRQGRRRVLNELARVARQWTVVEYRVERPVKAAKRALIRRLTGRTGRKRMGIADIAVELAACGLTAERYYFISRWFSGSVFIMARRHSPPVETQYVPARVRPDARPPDIDTAVVTSSLSATTTSVTDNDLTIPTQNLRQGHAAHEPP